MENYNDSIPPVPPTYPKNEKRNKVKTSKSIKAIVIATLAVLLLIPMEMIKSIIRERNYTESEAVEEVSQKWSAKQIISGPYLNFDYITTHETVVDGKTSVFTETKNLVLLPDELSIDGQLYTETRKRGIYEVNVYQSDLKISGTFSPEELKKRGIDIENIQFENVTICLAVSDMRGISEQIKFTLGGVSNVFEPGMNGKELGSGGVSQVIDVARLKTDALPYQINLKLKGSQGMFFTPLGKTTKVDLQADWGTPSFDGNYLPESRDITDAGFTAKWQVLNLNRNFPQSFFGTNNQSAIMNSLFGVELKVPVEQYQQSMRSAKYAILIIALTFAVIFFVEIMDKKKIHALQYLLIGLALCLFYTLLVSMSEQMNFTLAYLLASGLTIGLTALYIGSIMKKKKPAFVIAGLLAALYGYIFVLIQLETLALLAGSLGLFVILAVIMYFSRKIDWFNE